MVVDHTLVIVSCVQAVVRSLSEAGCFVYQTHFVTREGLDWAEAVYRRGWNPRRGGALHVWQGQWVRRQLEHQPERRWKVITLVRDPVARNLSSFFQVADLNDERHRHRDEQPEDPAASGVHGQTGARPGQHPVVEGVAQRQCTGEHCECGSQRQGGPVRHDQDAASPRGIGSEIEIRGGHG